MRLAVAILLAVGIATPCFAESDPPGTQGRDWDRRDFTISSGATLRITGTVKSIPTRSGNTSSVAITVNGRRVAFRPVDAAGTSVSYDLSENGDYKVYALCGNEGADADSCTLTIEKVRPKMVY